MAGVFIGQTYNGTHFSNMDVENYNNCVFYRCVFMGVKMWHVSFSNCRFVGCVFNDVVIAFSQINDCLLQLCTWERVRGDGNIINRTNIPMACPEEGAFTAYKAVKSVNGQKIIAELLVPAGARRSSGLSRKCRVECAKVVGFYNLDLQKTRHRKAHSYWLPSFVYEKGTTVYPHDFDLCRYDECAPGIHCFMTKEEARDVRI